MILLIGIGVALIGLLVLAAMSASEETTQRERRIERDLDMRRSGCGKTTGA